MNAQQTYELSKELIEDGRSIRARIWSQPGDRATP